MWIVCKRIVSGKRKKKVPGKNRFATMEWNKKKGTHTKIMQPIKSISDTRDILYYVKVRLIHDRFATHTAHQLTKYRFTERRYHLIDIAFDFVYFCFVAVFSFVYAHSCDFKNAWCAVDVETHCTQSTGIYFNWVDDYLCIRRRQRNDVHMRWKKFAKLSVRFANVVVCISLSLCPLNAWKVSCFFFRLEQKYGPTSTRTIRKSSMCQCGWKHSNKLE